HGSRGVGHDLRQPRPRLHVRGRAALGHVRRRRARRRLERHRLAPAGPQLGWVHGQASGGAVRRAAALLAVAILVAACGAPQPAARKRSKLAIAQATHEYPSPKPPPEVSSATSPSPAEAVRSFTTAYINWTADTVAADT